MSRTVSKRYKTDSEKLQNELAKDFLITSQKILAKVSLDVPNLKGLTDL
jgi:hypothetical protein